jgi:hypothetical protein
MLLKIVFNRGFGKIPYLPKENGRKFLSLMEVMGKISISFPLYG